MTFFNSGIRMLLAIFFSIFCITLAFIVLALTFKRRTCFYLARRLYGPGILRIAGFRLKVIGIENLDKSETYIITPNHQSVVDIAILFAGLPHDLHFISKDELKYVPFIGWFIWATGMIFIKRKRPSDAMKSIKKAAKLIKNGRTVVSFPEGTRNLSEKILPFKKGSFLLAKLAKVAVLPVAIIGIRENLKFDHSLLKTVDITLRIGRAIQVDQASSEASLRLDTYKHLVHLCEGEIVKKRPSVA